MDTSSPETSERDERLAQAAETCLKVLEDGGALGRSQLEARFPEFAAELADFLAGQEQLERLAGPLREVARAARSAAGDADADGPLDASLVGRRVGDCELLEVLGQGGMAVVYKARQQTPNRLVALKMVRADQAGSAGERQRLRDEAEIIADLDHPAIVPVYGVGETDGQVWFSMKLIEGGSLADALRPPRPPIGPKGAARLVAAAASAVHHAHQRGVLHRDLKPANILLDAEGNPHVTDFGLARRVDVGSRITQSGVAVGTPAYMAPEQASGRRGAVTLASDVYGLGAVLYELLTGRPPFRGETALDTLLQVLECEPEPPSRTNRRINRDLETICLKCLHKEPARRYASAEALAEDLERWLAREPIHARPVGRAERLWLRCRRHPAAAGLVGAVAVLLAATVVATVWAAVAANAREREAQARAEAARGREQEAKAREEEARGRERDRQRDSLWQRMQFARRGTHLDGWSERTRQLAAEVAALRADDQLRDEMAAALAGIDARPREPLGSVEAASIAFDPSGKRLLLGGTSDWESNRLLEGARLWDGATGTLTTSQQRGPGPVAFRPDGTAVQLALGKAALLLWDVAGQRSLSECRLDLDPANQPRGFVANALRYPLLALSPEGSLVAAAISRLRQDTIAVWQGESGKLLFERPRTSVSALAFSPQGDLLAVGDKEGQVDLWSVAQGERVAVLKGVRMTLHALAFSHDAGCSPKEEARGSLRGRLATGDAGGTVLIWDLASEQLLARCPGSPHDVFAVAFSPDGMLLASAGRGQIRLWDAAGGTPLLGLASGDHVTGLAFSRDGKRLAVSGRAHPFHAGQVIVWDLEFGRGIQTFHGLTAPIARVCFSDDGRLLAALGHTWEVAVWDIEKGCLLRKLETPRGVSSDQSGLAFSPDGRRLAFSARDEARLWDVGTGEVLGSWKLGLGLNDAVAFTPTGKLLAARVEQRPRSPEQDWRLRELVCPNTAATVAEQKSFNGWTSHALAAPDGSCFAIQILRGEGAGKRPFALAFDGDSGAERWSHPLQEKLSPGLAMDPEGRVLSIFPWDRPDRGILVDMASGKEVGSLAFRPQGLSPGADYLVLDAPGGKERGYALLRRGDRSPLVVLGIDAPPSSPPLFSRDASRLAWGSSDGAVLVCHPRVVGEQLARIGLGW